MRWLSTSSDPPRLLTTVRPSFAARLPNEGNKGEKEKRAAGGVLEILVRAVARLVDADKLAEAAHVVGRHLGPDALLDAVVSARQEAVVQLRVVVLCKRPERKILI